MWWTIDLNLEADGQPTLDIHGLGIDTVSFTVDH